MHLDFTFTVLTKGGKKFYFRVVRILGLEVKRSQFVLSIKSCVGLNLSKNTKIKVQNCSFTFCFVWV
jgi:hypothetical protein